MQTLLKLRLTGTAAALLLSGIAMAQELTVGVQNMSAYLDPGRDFSNVGSQHYFNSFDPLIGKCYVRRSLGSVTPLRPSFI